MSRAIDRTVARRVAAYRERQSSECGLDRIEVRANRRDRQLILRHAEALRQRRGALTDNPRVGFVLNTVNAPRPLRIDAGTFLDCLLSNGEVTTYRPYIDAFFTEVSIEAIHWLVLSGVCTFEDLRRAAYTWRIPHNDRTAWIEEMAALSLARDAERRAADPARSAAGI